jgi:integrase
MWRIIKRGKVWHAYQSIDGRKVMRSTGQPTREGAERVARRWDLEDADPSVAASRAATLETAIAELVADRRARGRADATIGFIEEKGAAVLDGLGLDTPLADLTAERIDAYSANRSLEVSRATVAKELGVLRAALRLAHRRGKLAKHPASLIQPIEAAYVPRRSHLSRAEVDRVLAELPKHRADVVRVLVGAAVRLSEAFAMQPGDIAEDRRTFVARGTKTDTSAGLAPISPLGADYLRGVTLPLQPWASLHRDLAAACKRANAPRVTPNDLRRSAAVWLVERGAPSILVGRVLRHVDARMVERVYGQPSAASVAATLAALTATRLQPATPKTEKREKHARAVNR